MARVVVLLAGGYAALPGVASALMCLDMSVSGCAWHILLVSISFATVFVVLNDVWGEMFFCSGFLLNGAFCARRDKKHVCKESFFDLRNVCFVFFLLFAKK